MKLGPTQGGTTRASKARRGYALTGLHGGLALTEAEQFAQLDPSLLVSYVLHFGPADERIASRPVRVRVSLVAADVIVEELGAVDPNPQPGDSRD